MKRRIPVSQPFDLELSLTMGQAFRWRELGDGWFSGVLGEWLVHVRRTDDGIEYKIGGADGERNDVDLDEALRGYFRLDTDDVCAIYDEISRRDPKIASIARDYPGLRLLRQDPWECAVSYICSPRKQVENISRNVEDIANLLGKPLKLGYDVRSAFPTPKEMLSKADEALLLDNVKLGSHSKARGIMEAAERFCDGRLDPNLLMNLPYPEAKMRLMDCHGIGHKTADCIALMSLDKLEAFPVDNAWVWRAVTETYPEWGFPEEKNPSEANLVKASKRGRAVFGKYAGYANQLLLYWRRQRGKEPLLFGTRWRGKFRMPPGDDPRYETLARKYLRC